MDLTDANSFWTNCMTFSRGLNQMSDIDVFCDDKKSFEVLSVTIFSNCRYDVLLKTVFRR